MISVALVHRFMKHAAPAVRLFLANVYLLVPPVLNPIIYTNQFAKKGEALQPLDQRDVHAIVAETCLSSIDFMERDFNMKNYNNSLEFLPTTFILVGIPGLEAEHIWISIPFILMYIIIFLGNGTILHVIRTDTALHQPMYLFLAMLALAEVGVSASTLPTVLGIFLFGTTEISFDACLLQMFSIHSFSIMESAVLLAMSVDRFVAIYSPLRYTAILTLPRIFGTRSCHWAEEHYANGPIAHALTAPALLTQILVLHSSIMSEVTNTTKGPFYFILTGIPGFEASHIWISIPFCCLYTISIMGNTTILYVIRTEPSLHQPMYLFLSMLALMTWVSPSPLFPLLCNSSGSIFFFFLHGFSFMESSVLLAMSFDRYVAICRPLHYATILTNEVIGKIGLAIICRCVLAVLPSLFLLKRLPFCHSHLLSHSYCLHQDMIHLVCGDIRFNSWYGFALVLLIIVMDPLLIVLSYAMILKSVLGVATWTERLRALNNCLSHILAVLVLYVPMVGLSMTHRFAKHASPLVHVIMANMYLLAPPVMNPIIYSVKTKQIRQGMFRLLFQRKSGSPQGWEATRQSGEGDVPSHLCCCHCWQHKPQLALVT
ncbi:hypothetical protein QTO34_003824 [Cnephaeus nilssonii]|uniref:G-protein coupled receptors family 1 profile domain-containing protein n=1 Tax=Cnephaeus nilssonii TaxID=3371016 RepID=A0AA40HRE1_CNENI|nr:hypothetical protein QTO34_003824 [Eptesicus nilssonii]